MKTSTKTLIAILAPVIAIAGTAAEAQGSFRVGGARAPNGGAAVHGQVRGQAPNGAYGARRGTAVRGPNGGAVVRGSARGRTADGSYISRRGTAVRGPNGGSAVRGANTTVSPDGTVQRRAGFAAEGQNGQAQSEANLYRNPDGSIDYNRTTSATNHNSGNSYNGQVTVDPVTGERSRTYSCTDASGATISCPR